MTKTAIPTPPDTFIQVDFFFVLVSAGSPGGGGGGPDEPGVPFCGRAGGTNKKLLIRTGRGNNNDGQRRNCGNNGDFINNIDFCLWL